MTHARVQCNRHRRRLFAGLAVVVALLALGVAGSLRPGSQAASALPGRLAYVVGGNIWIWQGGSGRQITKGGQDGSPALSPDGSRLAYIRYDYSFSDLVISAAGGGEPQFLTDNRPPGETGSKDFVDKAVWALEPAWTSDGGGLTYTSDRGTDAPVLWAMDADGGNAHQLRTSPPAPPLEHPRPAPDGSILATSFGSGKAEVWRLDRSSGAWAEVAAPPDGAYDPAPSVDGKWVVYAGRTGKATDLWVVPADRAAPATQLTRLGRARAPVFSPDGGQLAFLAEKDERFQIFVAAVRASNGALTLDSPQQVTSLAQGVDATSRLSWSR